MANLLPVRAIFLGVREVLGVRSAARLEKTPWIPVGGYKFSYYSSQVFPTALPTTLQTPDSKGIYMTFSRPKSEFPAMLKPRSR
jgi:hypothetical protein